MSGNNLATLADGFVEDVMSLTDAELEQEIIEDGERPEEVVQQTRTLIRAAIAKATGATDDQPD